MLPLLRYLSRFMPIGSIGMFDSILSVADFLKLNIILPNKNPALVERENHQGASMSMTITYEGCNPFFIYRIFTIDWFV